MDDLVARLRECWCHIGWTDRGLVDPACDHDGVRGEAADEIERLRDGILKYVATISDCYCTPAMERDALELLKGVWRGEYDIVIRLREWASQFGTYEGEQKNADDLRSAADEIERLRVVNQMLNEALSNKGIKQVAKVVSTTRSCDEWMLPIFAKDNRHLCDNCSGEKYHHSYEWVPAGTPIGGSYKPWSLEQIHKWREDDLITNERYHFLVSVTKDFDKPKAVSND